MRGFREAAARAVLLAGVAAGGLATAGTALAQDAGAPPVAAPQGPATAAQQGSGFADIVVTANRREEAIQKVPTAVTALTNENLREQHIQSASDLLGKIPSVSVQPNGTQRDAEGITIRGQGQSYLAPVGVVNYFAEVPLIQGSIIANQGGPGNFLDLETLQVLRGPQGTLFGKNTTGGALLFGPHRPTNRFEGYAQAQFGNYNDREFEGVVNVPIISDALMIRIAAQKVDRDGYTKDVGTGDTLLSLPFQNFTSGNAGFAQLYPNSGLVLPGNAPNTGSFGLPGVNDTSKDNRGRDYDDRHYWTVRLGILMKPADGIENYLVGYYTRDHNNGTGQVLTSVSTDHPTLINLIANAYSNPFTATSPAAFDPNNSSIAQQVLARQQALGPRRVSLNNDQFYRLETWSIVDTFSAKLTDGLTFRNIFGYQRMKQNYNWDLDGSYLPVLSQVPNIIEPSYLVQLPEIASVAKVGQRPLVTNTSQISEEPQIQANLLDGKLVGVIGGFYSKVKPEGLESTGAYNGATFGGGVFGVTTTSKALYGQATLDLGTLVPSLDRLKLTGGVRHTWDDFSGFAYNPTYVLLPINIARQKTQATTWTVGLDYQVTSRVLLFGKITRGYKAGGFVYSAVEPAGQTFAPEYVTSYEIGAKTDFRVGGVPVRFNVSAYDLEYKGIQRANGDNVANGCTPGGGGPGRCIVTGNTTGLDQGAITFNAGSARVRGIELETTARLFPGFELSGSYSYTDAKYTRYFLNIPADSPSGPAVGVKQTCNGPVPIPTSGSGVLVNLTCSPFPFTPKNQFSINARYTFKAGSAGDIVLNGNYSHADRAWSAPASLPTQMPSGYIDSFNVLNASIDWNGIGGSHIDARLFVTNLTNTTFRISNSNGDDNSLGYSASIYNEPRMFGGSIRYRFGG